MNKRVLIGVSAGAVIIAGLIAGVWYLRARATADLVKIQVKSETKAVQENEATSLGKELLKAPSDKDGDLLSDEEEIAKGTDPDNPDTDGDGMLDGQEVREGKDPNKADARREAPAEDAESSLAPVVNTLTPTTPVPVTNPDADSDGLTAEQEANLGTDPNNADTDGDGLTDRQEVETYKTDPLKADSDNDTFLDGAEVQAGYNPLGPGNCARETCIP